MQRKSYLRKEFFPQLPIFSRNMWHNRSMLFRSGASAFLALSFMALYGSAAHAQVEVPVTAFPGTLGTSAHCNESTKIELYYDKKEAIRNGIVPFRILLNADDYERILDNPQIVNMYQVVKSEDGSVERIPVTDAFLEMSNAGTSTFYDGYIHMKSADVVAVAFTLQCFGPGGYDFVENAKTPQWTIPDTTEHIGIAELLTTKNFATILVGLGIAMALPGLILNIFPQLAHSLQYFGAFFSVHRRKNRWGIVVDSDLGKPIAHAVVQVFDAKFNQLKETQITGKDGQFGFLLPAGSYYVVASNAGFIFPARKKPPTVLQKGERLYLGEEFETDEKDPNKVPHLVVPMDREEKVPLSRLIARRYFERILAFVDSVGFTFLFIGAGINTYFFLTIPGTINTIFEALYLLMFALKLYIMLTHQKGLGDVVDRETGGPLDLAILRLYDTKTNRIMQTRVTNVNGRFFILVPRGSYTASVSKPGYKTALEENISIMGASSKALSLHFKLAKEGPQTPPPAVS